MADLDDEELAFNGPGAEDVDLSDETQDFRFLAQLTGTDAPKIPKRGEKDFEPHATALQSDTLAASRAAMHAVLSTPRIHKPKQHSVAIYHAESNMAYVYRPKGNFGRTMGMAKSDTLWLLPEEALHLLERGSLDIRWPVEKEKDESTGEDASNSDEEGKDDQEEEGIPMSLQGAYAAFIGMERSGGGKLTLEMFTVYSSLKRAGYTVLRADHWEDDRPPLDGGFMPIGLFDRLKEWWLDSASRIPQGRLAQGPIVKPGLYRSYADIYRLLQVIPTHDQRTPPKFSLPPDSTNPFRVVYHVWKPSTPFKKSARPPPDFRIAVVNARETLVPTLSQLNDLLATTPYCPPPETMKRSIDARLKHGYRSIIVAVVDQGVTSYNRIADSGFANEKLYNRHPAGGNKRGGFRGGRGGGGRGGRGRGR